jgi:hypothetical protein
MEEQEKQEVVKGWKIRDVIPGSKDSFVVMMSPEL